MATAIPANRASFSVDELVRVTGGRLLSAPSASHCVGVCSDSRTVVAGNVFIALRGEQFDAHSYVPAVRASGAAAAIVERPLDELGDFPLILVDNATHALGALASYHRSRWAGSAAGRHVIGITGSAGKTTTCRTVSAALSSALAVHQPVGNLNNAVGIPMTLLGLESDHQVSVVEMGTSQPGEIAHAMGIVKPTVSLLTLVARAHTQGLGSLELVAAEKGAIYRELDPTGIGIVNLDDPLAAAHAQGLKRSISYGGHRRADVAILGSATDGLMQRVHLSLMGRPLEVVTPVLGDAGRYAVAAAMAVGTALGFTDVQLDRAAQNLSNMLPEPGRLHVVNGPMGILIIDDTYNANPASMASSLRVARTMAEERNRRLVAVLGEMRELGDQSVSEHRKLGECVARSGVRVLITVGNEARPIAEAMSVTGAVVESVTSWSEASKVLRPQLRESDVLFVKGSRGVALERLVGEVLGWGGKTP